MKTDEQGRDAGETFTELDREEAGMTGCRNGDREERERKQESEGRGERENVHGTTV